MFTGTVLNYVSNRIYYLDSFLAFRTTGNRSRIQKGPYVAFQQQVCAYNMYIL